MIDVSRYMRTVPSSAIVYSGLGAASQTKPSGSVNAPVVPPELATAVSRTIDTPALAACSNRAGSRRANDIVSQLNARRTVTAEGRPQTEDHFTSLEQADFIVGPVSVGPTERLIEARRDLRYVRHVLPGPCRRRALLALLSHGDFRA